MNRLLCASKLAFVKSGHICSQKNTDANVPSHQMVYKISGRYLLLRCDLSHLKSTNITVDARQAPETNKKEKDTIES